MKSVVTRANEQYISERDRRENQEAQRESHRQQQKQSEYAGMQKCIKARTDAYLSQNSSGFKVRAEDVKSCDAQLSTVLRDITKSSHILKSSDEYYKLGSSELLHWTQTAIGVRYSDSILVKGISIWEFYVETDQIYEKNIKADWVLAFNMARQYLEIAFLFGKVEAIKPLSYIYAYNWHEKVNHELSRLVRGVKEKLENVNFVHKDPTKNALISKCAEVIKQNASKYGDSKITSKMLIEAQQNYNNGLDYIYQIHAANNSEVNMGHHIHIETSNLPQADDQKQDIKQNGKIIDIAFKGMVFGKVYDHEIIGPVKLKVNGQLVTIDKYRSLTIPDHIKPGEDIQCSYAIKQPNGRNILQSDAAYLIVKYDSSGKLMKLSVPSNPAISYTDEQAPALVMYNQKVYTLPVSSGNYWHLKQLVEKNQGTIVIENPNINIHVEPLIFLPTAHVHYQPLRIFQANELNTPLIGTTNQPVDNDLCSCNIL